MVKENYRCGCCGCWYDKKDLDHINYLGGKHGGLLIRIICKKCEKLGCLIKCKYMPS